MGFDISIICRALLDTQITMNVEQAAPGAGGTEERPFTCTEINTQFVQTFRFADDRWANGTASAQATLTEAQGTVFHTFSRQITVRPSW
nr:hypothetical protein GCM10010200_011750 [Actinomadura rugatobispora]